MTEQNHEKLVQEDYRSAIADLSVNSKPLITMLTMLADENRKYASVITQVVITHMKSTTFKLPALYLVDSIVKNVGNDYKRLFGNCIANVFAAVFKEVDEKTRKKMYELRQTWNEVFPKSRLFHLDTNIHEIDPAWPITSQPQPPGRIAQSPTIHVNPNKFKAGIPLQPSTSKIGASAAVPIMPEVHPSPVTTSHDIEELQKLQNEKRVLEETRKTVEKMMKEKDKSSDGSSKMADPTQTQNILQPTRRSFLQNYKVKKRLPEKMEGQNSSQSKEKVPNIYIAPWKAKQILPGMTPSAPSVVSKNPRVGPTSCRDPRIPHPEGPQKDPRQGIHEVTKPIIDGPRDPRLSGLPVSRDPRLNKASGQTVTHTPTVGTTVSPLIPNQPRVIPHWDPKVSQSEKKIEKEKVKAEDPKVEKEHVPKIKKEIPKEKEGTKKEKHKEKEKEKEREKSKERESDKSKERDREKSKERDREKSRERDREKSKERDKSREREKSKEREKEKKKHSHSKSSRSPPDREQKEQEIKANEKEKEIKKDAKEKNGEKTLPSPAPAKTTALSSKDKPDISSEASPTSNISNASVTGLTTSVKLYNEKSLSPAHDKFKTKTNEGTVRNRRREHIRPRIESPVEDIKIEDVKMDDPVVEPKPEPETVQQSVQGQTETIVRNESTKRPLNDREQSDSDDSDHYDGNKPQTSLYPAKKVKSEVPSESLGSTAITQNQPLPAESNQVVPTGPNQPAPAAPNKPGPATANQPFPVPSTDQDYRQIRPQPERIAGQGEGKDGSLICLFGSEDTDLRKLAAPKPQHLAAPFDVSDQSKLPIGATYAGKPDEDMRIPKEPMKAPPLPKGQENRDPRFAAMFSTDPSSTEDPLLAERAKRLGFNSPHAAKWEKFREKNPEFKEYQRQASISEKMEIETSENFVHDSNSSVGTEKSLGRGGRFLDRKRCRKDIDRTTFEDSMRRGQSPPEVAEPGEESYQFMITQLNDQLKRGEISRNEYGRCMEDIRFMMEKGKIRELQAKEKGRFDSAPWSPGQRLKESNESGPWGRQFPLTHSDRFGAKGESQWHEGENAKIGPGWHGEQQRRASPRPPLNFRSGPVCSSQRLEEEWTGEPDLPAITEEVLRAVYRESETRTIDIDAKPREIRTYGEKAVVLMDWNDPRLLSFERVKCDVVFDKGQFVIPMSIGDPYQEFKIDGEKHRVKLGVPTQELMIDGKGYQCFFGGKPIAVHLAGKNRTISLDGRPPKVNIGTTKNLDFLLGKIDLIINARRIIPLYLDAKPQRFTIDGKPFVIKFIDAFNAVSLNGVKFPVVFGGLPISVSVRGYRQFLRFSQLPASVIPGKTTVKGLDTEGNTLIPTYPPSPSPPIIEPSRVAPQFNPTALPPSSNAAVMRAPLLNTPTPFSSTNTQSFNQAPQYPTQNPIRLPLGIIPAGPPPPSIAGIVPGSYLTAASLQSGIAPVTSHPILFPNLGQPPPQTPTTIPTSLAPPLNPVPGQVPASTPVPIPAAPVVDVQSLLDRLVRTGIIGGGKKEGKKDGRKETHKEKAEDKKTKLKDEDEEEEEIDDLKDLPPMEVMFNLDNLRKRNDKLIKRMYRGMQCSSCGLRYPPEQTQQYSHHLDWHFRMNKKQQDSTKKVSTRKFYLCFDDWVQYEEIEDIDERVPSMFEMEGQMNTKKLDEDAEDGEEEIPSIAVSSDTSSGVCPICHETFDQFYHQNTEEWHYKYAIQVEGINYHPGCHQDMIKAQKQEEERLRKEEEEKAKQEEERLKKDEEEKQKQEEERKLKEEMKGETKDTVTLEDDKTKEDDDDDEPKVIEDEEIQEIEKETDTTPKEEIDLTNEDEQVEPEEKAEPSIKQIKNEKVEAIRKKMKSLWSGLPPPKMKEEPSEGDAEMKVFVAPRQPPLLADIPIKMEIEDEADQPLSIDVEDDDIIESGVVIQDTWLAPMNISTPAQTDIACLIDGNSELDRPETSRPSTTVPKIKISVSIPTQNNIEDQLTAMNNHICLDNGDLTNDIENHYNDFVPPPFTVDYERKPSFKGVTLREQPVAHRGMEISSLCSLM